MIVTVTLNLAVDVTYHLGRFERGATSRVERVDRRAGGKGVNVARVLHTLGHDALVVGLAGGCTGAAAEAELTASGIPSDLEPIAGESRMTLMVVEADGEATGFSESGPAIAAPEWHRLLERCRRRFAGAAALVLSGSVPPGIPSDGYATLIAEARRAGVPAILDTDGPHLAAALAARPAIVKVNAQELAGVCPGADVFEGARWMLDQGAQAVVVSQGPKGLICLAHGRGLRCAPPRSLSGNPTGAGDAAAAALAVGLLGDVSWRERLAEATALSAASVCAPLAGSFDDAVYRSLRGAIEVHDVQVD